MSSVAPDPSPVKYCPCCGGPVVAAQYLTPEEAGALMHQAASTWRNKAAAGAVPGALKKGNQWLLPRAAVVVRVQPPVPGETP